MSQNTRFWQMLDELVQRHPITLDRPKGSRHPRNEEIIYDHNYGYLQGTASPDGGRSMSGWAKAASCASRA